MGVVYLAQDDLGLIVAVKMLRPEMSADPRFRERFRREVGAAFRIHGTCVPRLIAADPEAPQPYFVSEYVEGPTLEQYLDEHGPLDHDNLVAFAAGVAEALVAIHAAGLVHRDLKPANVVLSTDGPKVLDFGVSFDTQATTLTLAGETLGSPGWMAPEQARGERITPATDTFSWGMVVAAAGSGRNPFGTGTPDALIYRVVHEQPVLAGLDPAVLPLVAAALGKAPADRPSDMQILTRLVPGAGRDITVAGDLTAQFLTRAWSVNVTTPTAAHTRSDGSPRSRGRNTGRRWLVAVAAVLAIGAAVLAVLLSRGPSTQNNASITRRLASTTTASPTTSSSTATTTTSTTTTPVVTAPGNQLVQRSGQGYSIAVPSSWKYVDASIPSDHSTFLYTDPNNALRKLQIVVSGCSGCVMNVQDTNDTSLHPENVVPQGASTYRISQRKIAFETYTDGEPYPDNGIIIAATDGYVEADLWLPDSEHATATRILNSFQGP